MPQAKIAVIGAGLSGLTVAHLLQEHGVHNVKVFEASDHVGGRVHTLRQFGDNLHAEAGGMMFTDTEPKIAALAEKMSIEIVARPDGMQRRYFFDDQWNDGHVANEFMGLMFAEIQKLNTQFGSPSEWSTKESAYLDALDSMSIVKYFTQKSKAPEDVYRTLSATLLGLYPDNLDDLSALDALRVMSQYASIKKMYSIKGGNDRLPEALASSLNQQQPTVFLNKPVSEVVYENNQWKISFTNQTETEFFDYVVMATPLSMLQPKNPDAIKLPDLPEERRNMLNEIPYAQSMARVYCEVDQRFWKTDAAATVNNANVVTNQPTFWIEDHTVAQAGTSAVIEAHTCNQKGRDIQQDLDPKKAGQQAIASVYGEQFTQHLASEKTTTVIWKDKHYQKGTYPYFRTGQRHIWAKLGNPINGSFFIAGEYATPNRPISMEGALESAYRVVNEELLPAQSSAAAARTVGLFAPQHVSEERVSQQTENKPASFRLCVML